MPMVHPSGAKNYVAQLGENVFFTEDGTRLPLRHWLPRTEPHAVIIALHGFNDYSHFFDLPGGYFSKQGIASFAYDQRGFGATSRRGAWAGTETYAEDLLVFTRLIKQRYPKHPIYLLGESMGGAIVIAAMREKDRQEIAGIILVAPALWARSTMPWYQTGLLWMLAHSLPWLTLTGKDLDIMASDNIDMLRALGRDPLVIKETRVDTMHGLVDLMDSAFDSAPSLRGNILMLYGEKDEIIPKEPTYLFVKQLLTTDAMKKSVLIYPHGYHMLLRDLQGPVVWEDIAAWINSNPDKLLSGNDDRARHAKDLVKNNFRHETVNR